MHHSSLARFSPLYRASRYYGADKILQRHLGVGDDYVVPLGLCHGVDFGQMREPGDVRSLEPIYWAYNETLLSAAQPIKPAVAVPHPFLLSAGDDLPEPREDVLVVGPPPGRENDRRLHESLRFLGLAGGAMLVKRRIGWEGSGQFWQSHGYTPVTFGQPDVITYADMAALFRSYRHVVSGTVSSAVTFAAAVGAKITLIRDYRFSAYDNLELEASLPSDYKQASRFVGVLAGSDQEAKVRASRSVLGANLDAAPERIRADLDDAIAALRSPLYVPRPYPKPIQFVLREAAIRLQRPGLLVTELSKRIQPNGGKRVGIQEVNEVDLWLNGRSPENFSLREVPFVRGATEPGFAVDPYYGL